ncbi:MAG TPA: transporter [Gemmatimonadaceae bacterium]
MSLTSMRRDRRHRGFFPWRLLVSAALIVTVAQRTQAQANIPVFRGDVGLLAGTQAPPGAYAGLFFNNYHATQVIDAFGRSLPINTTINALAILLEYSAPYKVLGGRWAALAGIPWVNTAISVANITTPGNWGFSDVYVVPLQLGWTLRQADLLFGQGFFAPSGRFHPGSADNTGLGVWSWESTLGATVYKDMTKRTSFSTLASYQVQSFKRDTDQRPGQVLTLEGGIGEAVPLLRGRAGAVYYAQWKLTDDQGFTLPPNFDAHHRYFGIGPELTGAFPTKPVSVSLTLRYYRELWNRVAPQGGSLVLSGTAYLPSKQPKPPIKK